MRKILIIDDETIACANLFQKVSDLEPDAEIKTETSPVEALRVISEWKPDLLFLDIAMPGLTGFEMLEQIPPERREFDVIFCTAYSEHALAAFEAAAIDYLVKPVEPERLHKALQKSGRKNEKVWVEKLSDVGEQYLQKVTGTKGGVLHIFPVEEISVFTSMNHETLFIHNGQEFFTDLALATLEERLNPQDFLRVHRSFVVNLKKVISFDEKSLAIKVEGCDLDVKVSKRSKTAFKSFLKSK